MQARQERRQTQRQANWFEKILALIALANLILVLFDLTYIPLRDFYLQQSPGLVASYDPVKGIEPHRETQRYLDTVDQLERQLVETGPQGSQVASLLESLSNQSVAIINENPLRSRIRSAPWRKLKTECGNICSRTPPNRHLESSGAKPTLIRWAGLKRWNSLTGKFGP